MRFCNKKRCRVFAPICAVSNVLCSFLGCVLLSLKLLDGEADYSCDVTAVHLHQLLVVLRGAACSDHTNNAICVSLSKLPLLPSTCLSLGAKVTLVGSV